MDHPDLSQLPAAAPPPGVVPNFTDPPSQQVPMIAVSTVVLTLTTVFVTIRVYTGVQILHRFGIEEGQDAIILFAPGLVLTDSCPGLTLLATAFSAAYIGIILVLSHESRHLWDVPLIWFTENYWKIRFAGNTLQAFAYFTSHLPILVLYLRLFGRQAGFRVACYIALFADFAVYLTAIPLLSYFCTPHAGGDWNSLVVFAKCKTLLNWAVIQGSLDIALDLYIFLLPLPTVLSLHMPTQKKIGVLVVFLTGLFAVIASGIGFYFRYKLTFTPDINWNEGAYICAATVEINIAIICSCMPACANLYRHRKETSSIFSPIRLFLSQYVLKSSISGTEERSKASYTGDQSATEQEPHDTPSRHDYINLEDASTFGARSMAYYSGGRPHLPRILDKNGITKTIDLEVV
ncbi:hypothetical protein GGR55DRAFT_634411 [Xylaria sp. FL0064]|nr:hypothetical protein GGR55DRAFT_634411 [Xylaria sp. FL0064]